MKRITLFSGHYGSGKTNVAVSYAMYLASMSKTVSVYDMDIVNPYYRTLDAKPMLEKMGIRLVVSGFANSNVDLPAVTSEAYAMTADKSRYAVVDIGGDDRGALVLGRYAEDIKSENDYEFCFVLNKFRPETSTIEKADEIRNEIERVAKLKFTAIISNPNLSTETDLSVVEEGENFSLEYSKHSKLPLIMTGIEKSLYLREKNNIKIKNVLPIELIKYLSFR